MDSELQGCVVILIKINTLVAGIQIYHTWKSD